MASIYEVYGGDYSNEAILGRMNFSARALAQNIAQMSFNMRHESDTLWKGNNMEKEAVGLIKNKVTEISPHVRIDHLSKQTDTDMLPYLINGAVEYFRLIDYKNKKIYLFYITPFNMEQY